MLKNASCMANRKWQMSKRGLFCHLPFHIQAGLFQRPAREASLAYIICEPCIGTKDSACVDVCPVDCIHPRKDEPGFEAAEMLYIHPDECIDCGACVPACPVEAIFALDETPEKWKQFIPINADYFQK